LASACASNQQGKQFWKGGIKIMISLHTAADSGMLMIYLEQKRAPESALMLHASAHI